MITMTVYVKYLKDKQKITWKGAKTLPVTEYSISESGYREKTASITTNQHLDISTGVIQILITSPYHENFSGVILSEDYKPSNNQYTYKCKDFHVLYNNKFTKTYKKADGRNILIDALTWNSINQKKTSKGNYPMKTLRKYPRQLNGLRKNSKYEMINYGYGKRFNPMTKVYKKQKIQNKSCWEVIKAYTIGTGAFLDLKVNDYGTVLIEPFNINSFRKPVATISDVYDDLTFNASTEGLIELSGGGDMTKISTKDTSSNDKLQDDKASNNNNGNPYHCKNKEIWINMDDIWGKSNDKAYLNNVAKHLRKLGWKVHVDGVGPGYCGSLSSAKKAKNGLRVTINGGVDIDNIREHTQDTYFAKGCQKANVLPALFWTNMGKGNSFLKGGRGYTKYTTAWDGTGKANTLPYPASHMAKSGTPFGFVFSKGHKDSDAKAMAEKINNGGDSPKACQNNFFKITKKGFNHNVGDKSYGY